VISAGKCRHWLGGTEETSASVATLQAETSCRGGPDGASPFSLAVKSVAQFSVLPALPLPAACLAFCLSPKMKAVCLSETSIDFHRTIRQCHRE
jgi:hypothetical protein